MTPIGERDSVDGSREWVVVYGRDDGVEGYALREVTGLVQRYLDRPVAVERAASLGAEAMCRNLVVLGTACSNPLVGDFQQAGLLRAPTAVPESLAVRVLDSPLNPGRQVVVLTGSDEAGVLYAVRDFEHYVVDRAGRLEGAGRPVRVPFRDRFDEVELTGAPAIRYRGLWTWGHVIYDWRRYVDHMSRWKMNALVVWNDVCPVNAAEIVSYAHTRGVKVFWGYSWSWGEEVDPTAEEDLERWTRRVLEQYSHEYARTGCDGIYFQAFTETYETEFRGRPIAELAARWVNAIAGRLLERHPDLRILFGVHATSIRDNYPMLAAVNRSLTIVWEDVGGPPPQFPYSYDPDVVAGSEQAVSYTARIARLRAPDERVGIVVKGMTNLDWSTFRRQPGRLILGEWPSEYIERRAREKAPRWRFVEREWRRNLGYLLRTVKALVDARPVESSVFGLAEDGMWEARMWLPVALMAEAAWNPDRAPDELVDRVAATNDAFALC